MKHINCPKCNNELIPLSELYVDGDLQQTWCCTICNMAITTTEPLISTKSRHWVDYLYVSDAGGGDYFFVEIDRNLYDTDEDALTAADEIAQANFYCPLYIRTCTAEEAEELGYDTF